MDIYYIKYSDHNSEEGYYQNNPDEDTRFQITVSQASPHVGILRIYDEIDDGDKKELMQQKLKLINKVGGCSQVSAYQDLLKREGLAWILIASPGSSKLR